MNEKGISKMSEGRGESVGWLVTSNMFSLVAEVRWLAGLVLVVGFDGKEQRRGVVLGLCP